MRNLFCLLYVLSMCISHCFAQQPYQLGVQENVKGAAAPSYPTPQMITMPAAPAVKKAKKPISGHAAQTSGQTSGPVPKQIYGQATNNNIGQETFSAGTTQIALPPAFLGLWQVHGMRTVVDALPEFQAGAQQAFSVNNDQLWNISGDSSGGYTLGSNTGITTALIVDKVQGNTAFIRYQHPVGNTMAQESIVMSLRPGGTQFDGLERIAIVKQGLSQPRAKVTYQLSGVRK